ncbi:MAG: 3'-5' exoribonuclease YhaM family protein [Pirellulaceae bacterium]
MSRRFISQYGEHESVDDVFLASEKQLRTNRNGNLYLQVRLADRSGSVIGMLWNANDTVYTSFDNGDFVRIKGTTQFYNGSLQMIVNKIDRETPQKVNEADFVTLSGRDLDRLSRRLSELLRGVHNVALRSLAECFLMDESFVNRLRSAPAGVKNHHAYRGGLLDHIVSLMEVVASVAPHYPVLDQDLLLMGAFLHDVGKIDELVYERDLGYSDAGQLLGHVVQGVGIVESKIRETEKLSGEPFPEDLKLRLLHMVVSHHGEYEYGSPKLPMTLEAIALHFLDNLDAKMHSLSQLIRDDANTESRWTPFQAALGRKLYKA